MGKIGRNAPCPCGSGKKFKKCCLQQSALGEAAQQSAPSQPSLRNEIEKIQLDAMANKNIIRTLGVFVLFSTESGDGWVLEITDMDAVQVAAAGKKLDIEIDENSETIEVNWSHKFDVKDKKFVLTAYKDNAETVVENYPTHAIHAAVKKIRKSIPPELMESLHIDDEQQPKASA